MHLQQCNGQTITYVDTNNICQVAIIDLYQNNLGNVIIINTHIWLQAVTHTQTSNIHTWLRGSDVVQSILKLMYTYACIHTLKIVCMLIISNLC